VILSTEVTFSVEKRIMRFHFRYIAASTLACILALAPQIEAQAQSRNSTHVYAGIALSFGAAEQSGIGALVGLRSTRVNASNRLRGIDANARYDFRRGFDRVAVAGLIGRRNAYLNLGGGFDPLAGEVFVTGAAQARHLRAGVDYGLVTGAAGGYFELNTLDRPGRYVPPRRVNGSVGNGDDANGDEDESL
jgi:hypothetical protein